MSRLVASRRVCQNVSCVCSTDYRFWLTHVHQIFRYSSRYSPIGRRERSVRIRRRDLRFAIAPISGYFANYRRWRSTVAREERENRGIKERTSYQCKSAARYFIHSTTFSTPFGREMAKRERGEWGENRGDEPDVRSAYLSASFSLACERRREITRPFVLSYRARGTATGDSHDTHTSDTILGSRLSLTSSPPRVSRGRGELYPHRRCSGATWSRASGRGETSSRQSMYKASRVI